MADERRSQREILGRIDERTQAHYADFQEFKNMTSTRLDFHAKNIRVLEAHRNWIGGGIALAAAIGLPAILWKLAQ